MIRLPKSIDDARAHAATHDVRAGGTDLQERRIHGLSARPLLDLRDVAGLDQIEAEGEGLRIGAKVRLAELARHAEVRARYPGIAEGAGGLANPQIRAVATLGGNLLQAPRCPYFRNPDVRCLKSGGGECWARAGDHLWHVCFADRPCVAPHASTMGMILMAYDAEVEVAGGKGRTIEALYDFGATLRDHTLEAGALLTHVDLPAPWSEERAAYMRATSRARAEWALVEVLARLRLDAGGRILDARVAVGAVANAPLRLRSVEAALVGQRADDATFTAAGARAKEGASPLPQTAYKVELLAASVVDALTQAAARPPTPSYAPPAAAANAPAQETP
ncbi:MAG: FAD binding domain-containing protein [Nannocystaceae bacterium]